MATNLYPKGAEWRRWDLHIHTPGTQKNDQFEVKGTDINDRWNKYLDDINNYSGDITALGITDYVSLENYFKFKQYLSDGLLTKPINFILPNIELRIIPVTGSSTPINIHCIFNPDFDTRLQERFLNKLEFDNGGRMLSASRNDLIELGRTYRNLPSLDEDTAIREGIGQYVVTVKAIKQVFINDPELKENCFIVVANGSGDGASGLKDHYELFEGSKYTSLDVTRQMIYKYTNAIFSGSDSDVKYFSGEGVDSSDVLKQKCDGLKPCYHGCDAHENAKIFEPDLKRYCWIKADPTFNGLKQTLYEPRTRVRIQEDKPEEKKSYLVIDSVEYVFDQGKKVFSNKQIDLNDKLNAIIGGKSSGKSMLLYYIAKTIDPAQVNRKLEELEMGDIYGFEKDSGFDFKVTWGDGTVYALRQSHDNKNRQITYVPQMYINYLAERRGEEGLRTLIRSFLEEKSNFQTFLQNCQQNHDTAKSELASAITTFFQMREAKVKLADDLKGKGDKTARLASIATMNGQLSALRTIAGFTEEDEKQFEKLERDRRRHAERQTTLSQLKLFIETDYPGELEKLLRQVDSTFVNVSRLVQTKFGGHRFAGNSIQKEVNHDQKIIGETIKEIIDKSKANAEQIERLTILTSDKIKSIESVQGPYLAKIQNRDKLISLQSDISAEELVVAQIAEIEGSIAGVDIRIKEDYDKIIENYKSLLDYYKSVVDEINNKPEYAEISKEKGIQLEAFVSFDRDRFASGCTNFINKQTYFSNLFGNYFDSNNQYQFDLDTHIENFKEIFDMVLDSPDSGIRFNQGGNVQNISRSLFDDYLSVSYKLSQGTENIIRMSPGKKGLILLFLILHLSNADYPILIDQPEDNLDNRTVYTELKDFVRKKKIERQIIIVTHNANLVVPTDAENVIVANQEGQDSGKENVEFRFEYISGALENTYRAERENGILNKMGIKEHVCEILEGGEAAFIEREKRYALPD